MHWLAVTVRLRMVAEFTHVHTLALEIMGCPHMPLIAIASLRVSRILLKPYSTAWPLFQTAQEAKEGLQEHDHDR